MSTHTAIAKSMLFHLLDGMKYTYDKFSSLYNNTIAPYNLMAAMAVLDAYDAMEETPMFRQGVKKSMNRAKKIVDRYNADIKLVYGKKYTLFIDYCNQFSTAMNDDVERLRNAIVLALGRHGVRGHEQCKAALMLALHLCDNAHELHDGYMDICRRSGVRAEIIAAFDYADMGAAYHWLNEAAQAVMGMTDEQQDAYCREPSIKAGLDILNLYILKDGELDYRKIGYMALDALDMDREHYGEDADKARADLAAIDARHEAWLEAQRAAEAAEKAAADKVAEQMKIEAQKAKDEAVAARLSEKFNVKTKKR